MKKNYELVLALAPTDTSYFLSFSVSAQSDNLTCTPGRLADWLRQAGEVGGLVSVSSDLCKYIDGDKTYSGREGFVLKPVGWRCTVTMF